MLNKSISVKSVDTLAELRAEEHVGSLSSSLSQRRTESSKDGKVTGLKAPVKFEFFKNKNCTALYFLGIFLIF